MVMVVGTLPSSNFWANSRTADVLSELTRALNRSSPSSFCRCDTERRVSIIGTLPCLLLMRKLAPRQHDKEESHSLVMAFSVYICDQTHTEKAKRPNI